MANSKTASLVLGLTVFVLYACLFEKRVFAWSEGGQYLITSMAFRQLEPARQQEIPRILKAHLHFTEDFKAPANARDEKGMGDWSGGLLA